MAKRLVEVIHLCQDTAYNHNDKYVCRRVCELVVACEGHLQCNPESFDEHDGDGASGRADGEVNKRILAAVLGRDLVDHEGGKDGDEEAVDEEA